MIEHFLPFASVGLLLITLTLVALLFIQGKKIDPAPLVTRVDQLAAALDRSDRAAREESARLRQESAEQARHLREEVQNSLRHSTEAQVQSIDRISSLQQQRLEDFATRLDGVRHSSETAATTLRQEVTIALNTSRESLDKRLTDNATRLQQLFDSFNRKLSDLTSSSQQSATETRAELTTTLKSFQDTLQNHFSDGAAQLKNHFDSFATSLSSLTDSGVKKSEELRTTVENRLQQLQQENAAKLEEMRQTVDEKLQGTLEKRLGESFKLVSDRLEQVHKGLGEMQTLATGVGDLKRVLTNVKTRGSWGEMQLASLLEQILTPDQYATNVRVTPQSRETVEFAIKLPGREDGETEVWLPIDAKFPKEDYERLMEAAERGQADAVEAAAKALEIRLRAQARDIRDKYLKPPHTTDFGILYLPIEGLYAEALRRPGLADGLQRELRVVLAGPTTLAALLNSLQMGFRTLAIQKRSSEVWKVLGAVKSEFGKFGDVLEKVKIKLDETGATLEKAAHRSRQLEKKLRKVEALPASETAALLDAPSDDGISSPSADEMDD